MSAQIQSTRSGLDFQGDVWTRSSVSCWEFLEATKVHWSSGWRNSDHGSLSSSCTTNEQVEVGQAGSTGRCRQTVTSQPTPLSSPLSPYQCTVWIKHGQSEPTNFPRHHWNYEVIPIQIPTFQQSNISLHSPVHQPSVPTTRTGL